jgi:hypothetical protein
MLQVWNDNDVLAIVKANQEKYPYTISGLHSETQELLQSSSGNGPRCLEWGVLRFTVRVLSNGMYMYECSGIWIYMLFTIPVCVLKILMIA